MLTLAEAAFSLSIAALSLEVAALSPALALALTHPRAKTVCEIGQRTFTQNDLYSFCFVFRFPMTNRYTSIHRCFLIANFSIW